MKEPRSRVSISHGLIKESLEIIIHLGKNPVSGGTPARDRRRILSKGMKKVKFRFEEGNWQVLVRLNFIMARKMGVIIKEYRAKYTRDKDPQLKLRALNAQPRCVIEENARIDRI
jgi:hypothetical protein